MTENVDVQQKYAFAVALRRATPYAWFTWALLAINVAVFVAMGATGVGWVTPETAKVLHWGADFWPYTTGGQWWRLLTCAFVHFGVVHIGLNMWALYNVGNLTERLFGNVFFLLVYLSSALLSSLIAIWWDQHTIEAGASGAIFGIFGATVAYLLFQSASFPKIISKPLMSSVMFFIAFNIYFGLTNKGISNSAHVGGLISGFVIGAIVSRPLDLQSRKRQALPRMAAGVVIGAALVGGGIHFIPKSQYDVQNAEAFEAASQDASERASAVTQRYNEIVHQQATLPAAEIARRLNQDIIPEFAAIAAELANVPMKEGTPRRAARNLWVQFLRTRGDAIREWSLALQSTSPADRATHFKERDRLMKKAEDLRAQVDQAFSQLSGN